jgi:AraC family transcriptional regulator, regulatory protein of adaptative response / DNA-3-methyladenine glycosylase II
VFAVTPTQLREARGRRGQAPRARRVTLGPVSGRSDPAAPGLIRLRLPYRPPIDMDRMIGFLAARAIPGVEAVADGRYRRTMLLPNGMGILSVGSSTLGYVDCELQLEDLRDLTAAVQRCRRLLDLDADPEAVTASLAASESVLAPLALANPGRRVPGHVDGNELALRAVLGQQVSVAAARRLGARLVTAYGKPLERPEGTLTHCFPTAETLAAADPGTLPMPRTRAAALTGLATALASGDLSLDPGADRDRAEARLLALPGIGPWTVGYIRMRALSDPDAFLPADVGVLEALGRLGAGATGGGGDAGGRGPVAAARTRAARAATELAEGWRPWRSYAVQHLWASIEPTPENSTPSTQEKEDQS